MFASVAQERVHTFTDSVVIILYPSVSGISLLRAFLARLLSSLLKAALCFRVVRPSVCSHDNFRTVSNFSIRFSLRGWPHTPRELFELEVNPPGHSGPIRDLNRTFSNFLLSFQMIGRKSGDTTGGQDKGHGGHSADLRWPGHHFCQFSFNFFHRRLLL